MSKQAGRVLHLDGMRGVAILTVFAVHWAPASPHLLNGGYIGVDVFFVLSGYIITTLLARRTPTYGAFIGDRFRRLYPPLLGLLVVGGLLVTVWPRSGVDTADGWRAAGVALVQLMSPAMASGHAHMEPFIVTWSLAVEWYFYLLWPFVVAYLARKARFVAARWCAGIAVVAFGLGLLQDASWFYYGPLPRFGEMAAGAALAFWTLGGAKPRVHVLSPLLWFAPVFIGAWTVIGPNEYSWAYRIGALPLVALLSLALIAAGNAEDARHPVVRLLEWHPLVWVGGISYSLYLWHSLPVALIPSGWYGLSTPVLAAIGLALAGVTTWLGFVLLEKPFRHRRGADLQPRLGDASAPATRATGMSRG